MKNMKKILALALVIVSVLAISIPALAAVWSDRYGDIELYTNSGDNHDIMRMQTDLNTYFKNIPAYQLTDTLVRIQKPPSLSFSVEWDSLKMDV